MTHSQIVEFFLYHNVKINCLVKIQLLSGETFEARIADNKVLFEYDAKGFIINSHIKIIHSEALIEYKINQKSTDLFSNEIREIYFIR